MSMLPGGDAPTTMWKRLSQSMRTVTPAGPSEIIPPAERKAAMQTLGPVDLKWAKAGLVLDTVLSAFITYYLAVDHPTKKVTTKVHGKTVIHYVPLSGSYLLLGAAMLAMCVIGFFALRQRKRTLVAFTFFLTGFAFTLVFAPLGFALIILGGWLMLRAYRIQKYGTANAKQVAREAAARPPRRGYRTPADGAAKAAATPRGRSKASPKAGTPSKPKANKRYTPKSAPRRKVVKPTE